MSVPFFLGIFDDGGGLALSSKQLVDVGSITHVD